jgi:hypothetical protein
MIGPIGAPGNCYRSDTGTTDGIRICATFAPTKVARSRHITDMHLPQRLARILIRPFDCQLPGYISIWCGEPTS